MSHSISALLSRNLQEVFGEGDPAYAGTDFVIVRDGRIAALDLFFDALVI